MLKMKTTCERCQCALAADGAAHICSYECTFCPDCSNAMQQTCPNCDGVLVLRPTRLKAPLPVATGLLKRKWQRFKQGK